MFQFRFLENDNVEENKESQERDQKWFEAKEIQPKTHFVDKIKNAGCINIFKSNSVEIKHVSTNIINVLCEDIKHFPIFKAENNHSDLLTGIYEGGLKIWECTHDLVNYIIETPLDLRNKRILDLGCGAGIIGILTALNDCSFVCFQDYNEEVIEYITIPNVYLNSTDNKLSNKCRFYCGDWNSFLGLTKSDFCSHDNKFDYIFTSETIYNTSNYKKLHSVFKSCLKEDGVVYLAAKTHYFGVGGGLRQFEEFLEDENVFDYTICWKHSEGLQREILKITFKKSNVR